jgi:hypothetical protein
VCFVQFEYILTVTKLSVSLCVPFVIQLEDPKMTKTIVGVTELVTQGFQ